MPRNGHIILKLKYISKYVLGTHRTTWDDEIKMNFRDSYCEENRISSKSKAQLWK